jgi:hypothetical protein
LNDARSELECKRKTPLILEPILEFVDESPLAKTSLKRVHFL